jgi:hypothetical protein
MDGHILLAGLPVILVSLRIRWDSRKRGPQAGRDNADDRSRALFRRSHPGFGFVGTPIPKGHTQERYYRIMLDIALPAVLPANP